jgi:asparagine synthase (glutamine-hydrolysing)
MTYLAKVDRASMANSLEVRCPFLDYRLIEYSQNIPTAWKVDLFRTKKLMRKIIEGTVPDEIVHRRKKGFGVPVQKWILNEKYDPALMQSLGYLKDLSPEMHEFFSKKVLKENNRLYRRYRVRLLLFGKWLERWISN